jgi:hypothetical protein
MRACFASDLIMNFTHFYLVLFNTSPDALLKNLMLLGYESDTNRITNQVIVLFQVDQILMKISG